MFLIPWIRYLNWSFPQGGLFAAFKLASELWRARARAGSAHRIIKWKTTGRNLLAGWIGSCACSGTALCLTETVMNKPSQFTRQWWLLLPCRGTYVCFHDTPLSQPSWAVTLTIRLSLLQWKSWVPLMRFFRFYSGAVVLLAVQETSVLHKAQGRIKSKQNFTLTVDMQAFVIYCANI